MEEVVNVKLSKEYALFPAYCQKPSCVAWQDRLLADPAASG